MAPETAMAVFEVLEELTWGVGRGVDKYMYMLLSEINEQDYSVDGGLGAK